MGKLTSMGLILVLVSTAVVGAFELPRRFAAADEALVVQLAVAPPARARPEPIGLAVEKEEKRAKGRLYLSAALTVGAGLVAYWSKEKADEAYDRYLHSASAKRQNEFYAQARRYDRLAGTAYIGMEAGLVLSSYLLFFNR